MRIESSDPWATLAAREREVLALAPESLSNRAIVGLLVTDRAVEAHLAHVLAKLGLEESPDSHGRVLAVLELPRA